MAKKSTQTLAIDWLICHLRWGWLGIAFLIIILNLLLGETEAATYEITSTTYIIFGVGVVYNLLVVALLFIGWYPNWVAYGTALFDTTLSIVLMWITGGHDSFMLPALVFPVVTTVLRLTPETGLLLSALPTLLAYVASIIIKRDFDLIPVTKTVADLAVLFGAGIIAGYIAQKQLQIRSDKDIQEIKNLRIENDRAKVIYEMANTLSSNLNYRKVLSAMLDLAQLALSEADSSTKVKSSVGLVLLFNDEGPLGKLKMVAGRNVSRSDEGRQISVQEGILTQVIYKAEAIIDNNVKNDPALSEFVALKKCYSMVCAPLRAGFDMYGAVLLASPQKDVYTEEHASLLTTFCNQAIIALQNAELYQDLERKQKKLLEQEAQARRELARNLHDGPTQAIAAIAMRLNFVHMLLKREKDVSKSVEEIKKIEDIALRTTKEIRNMLFTLRPVVLETQGLAPAIEQYADRLRDLHDLNIKLDIKGYDGQLSTEAEGIIFAIIEEAVGNAKKYSEAEVIVIKLIARNDLVFAEVVDNGNGFDVDAVKSTYDQRGSLGLLNMEERAQMVSGRYRLKSAKGKGTSVQVQIPVKKNNN